MVLNKYFFASLCLMALSFNAMCSNPEQPLSIYRAIALAQQNDPWQDGNKLKQQAVESRSVAASSMPDPRVSVGMMNLPTDGWRFSQENMTQLTVGVTQMFPRGDSLSIKQQQLDIESSAYPLMRENRNAELARNIALLWLDAYLAQETIALIQGDWELFEQMLEVAKASYSNAIGKTRQQDVIRAQLEIVQLEDRLTEQQQHFEAAAAALSEWIQREPAHNAGVLPGAQRISSVTRKLPEIALLLPLSHDQRDVSREFLSMQLMTHPAIRAIGVKEMAYEKGVELAQQSYKPQWGVNASYAYRDDTPMGDSRADFFSVGVSFDLPLFTENRQDKLLDASIAETESVKTEKRLLLKQMLSVVEQERAALRRLKKRQSLYRDTILLQTHEQAEAALTAYTNDDGDFAEVVRARIAQLNARIALMKLDVEALKTITRINYFFTGIKAGHAHSHQREGE